MADALSATEVEKILQFQDLTGIEDVSICREVLARHSWDLEVSVQEQLNIREGRPSVFASAEMRAPTVVSNVTPQHAFFAPPTNANVSPRGIRGLFAYVVSFVWHLCFNTFSNFVQVAMRLVRPEARRLADPVGDVLSFIGTFEELYGACHPVFYRGTYSQALNDAKQELRFLLIYLHCKDHDDTDNFCRTTLTNNAVINYINTNMLFWACAVTSPEGYRVSQALRENGYPFLAVIVLRESRMTVVGRLEGPVEPNVLVQRLQCIVNDNEMGLVVARADRVERNFNHTLRQQQDEAYLESLHADEEKERQRKEEQARREGEELELKEQQMEEQNRKEEIRRQKIDFLSRVPEEPPADSPEALHIVIKLPDGTRLERRFLQHQSLESVFYYVFCHPSSPDIFEIATNFPKRVLACQEEQGVPVPTLQEAGLRSREVLFVYDLEA